MNDLSADSFTELCDIVARLRNINVQLNEAGTLIDTVQKPGGRRGSSTIEVVRESVLSDLKRKYSNLLLVYSKQFYLTPAANHGNFAMRDPAPDPFDLFMKEKGGK